MSLPTLREPEAVADTDVPSLLRLAVEKGISPEALEKLVVLQERVYDRNARLAFHESLARFQDACPRIPKTKLVDYSSQKGRVQYRFAPLETVTEVVADGLRTEGFSYTWDSQIENKIMTVTCSLRHVDGHSETASFACPTDAVSPGMNVQQAHGAALKYGMRQSLIQVLGLTTADPETEAVDPTPISEEQRQEIEGMLKTVKASRDRFLKFLAVESVGEIPAVMYEAAMNFLHAKGKQK